MPRVCGVQKFIPQGRAIAGYVLPVDSLNSESVPIRGLTSSAGCSLPEGCCLAEQPGKKNSVIVNELTIRAKRSLLARFVIFKELLE